MEKSTVHIIQTYSTGVWQYRKQPKENTVCEDDANFIIMHHFTLYLLPVTICMFLFFGADVIIINKPD